MSSKRWSALFGVLAMATAASTTAQVIEAPALRSFVRVAGDHFELAGVPFRFVGANVAVMHGDAHRAALSTTLDAVQADGLSIIRVWALGERDAGAPEWARSYAFRIGDDGWVESSFVHLDRVLAEAAARDLRVIIVLANRWGDYGGVPQYLRWSGDPFDTTTHDGIARAELGTFFRSTRAQALYTAHIEHVVGRTSSITGIAYRDDPTIFAWELVNEISAERRDAPALTAFVQTNAARIHTLDPNHLVSAGHIGYATSADRRTWRDVVALPEVDFADAHAYPTEHDRVTTLAELDAFVDDQAMLAHGVLHKPLVFGELGFAIGRRSLRRTRTQLFEHFLDHAAVRGVDGALAWIYAPSVDPAGAQTILADHPDRDSERVRAALSSGALELDSPFSPPSWPSSDAPLWDPSRTVIGTRRVAPASATIRIAPETFARGDSNPSVRMPAARSRISTAAGTAGSSIGFAHRVRSARPSPSRCVRAPSYLAWASARTPTTARACGSRSTTRCSAPSMFRPTMGSEGAFPSRCPSTMRSRTCCADRACARCDSKSTTTTQHTASVSTARRRGSSRSIRP